MKSEISLNEEIFNTRISNDIFDFFDKLSFEEKEKYLIMYKNYTFLLIKYLKERCHLEEYDEIISKSENNFKSLNESEMDIYQYLSSNQLIFFYIRNNLYIEKLTTSQQNILTRNENEPIYDDESRMLIETTLGKVIKNQQDNETHTFLGPNSSNFIVPVNSLVIGFRYDDYFKRENQTEESWAIEHNTRQGQIELLFPFMKGSLKKELHIPVEIIKYNEFSIKKKDEMEQNGIHK